MSTFKDIEVLYCAQYGGFSLSTIAIKELYRQYPDIFPQLTLDLTGEKSIQEDVFLQPESNIYYGYIQGADGKIRDVNSRHIDRTDHRIIEVIKRIGLVESSDEYCKLEIATVPAGYEYEIIEYDGFETVVIKFPYKQVLIDLINLAQTGSRDFAHPFTQKLIDKTLELS